MLAIHSDDTLYAEALAQQLAVLESALVDTLGEEPAPLACAHCFALQDLCACGHNLPWTLEHVVMRLRFELERRTMGGTLSMDVDA